MWRKSSKTHKYKKSKTALHEWEERLLPINKNSSVKQIFDQEQKTHEHKAEKEIKKVQHQLRNWKKEGKKKTDG